MRVYAVPLFAAAYFCIAGLPSLLHIGNSEEKYLLYHFFVFTEVPAREQTAFAVYVTHLRGRLVEPVRIEDAGVLIADELRNRPEYQRLINVLGWQLQGGAAEATQDEFESLISVRPLSYEVREVRYNPIDRFLAGEHISERTIGTFTVE